MNDKQREENSKKRVPPANFCEHLSEKDIQDHRRLLVCMSMNDHKNILLDSEIARVGECLRIFKKMFGEGAAE